jgi:hypothetical protein
MKREGRHDERANSPKIVFCGDNVCTVRGFGCVESAEMLCLATHFDLCLPAVPVWRYAFYSGVIVFARTSVRSVLCTSSLPKIAKPIIASNKVFMIDLITRPRPGDVEPRESGYLIGLTVDRYASIAMRN